MARFSDAAFAGRRAMGVQRLGLEVLVVPAELVVPFLDQIEGLGVVVGGGQVVEGERGEASARLT